jgi:hypothetical protein
MPFPLLYDRTNVSSIAIGQSVCVGEPMSSYETLLAQEERGLWFWEEIAQIYIEAIEHARWHLRNHAGGIGTSEFWRQHRLCWGGDWLGKEPKFQGCDFWS